MSNLFHKFLCLFVVCLMTNVLHANISVPFDLINGLIIIEAEVNGSMGSYIVDSGSNGILLNGSSKKSDVSYQSLSSTIEGSETKIRTFKVGNFEVSELLGFSTDLSSLEIYLDKTIDGILGCSIFTPNSLVFDFANSNMIISEDDLDVSKFDEYTSLSFNIIEELPVVELKIGGVNYNFILDSGASSHFVDVNLIDSNINTVSSTGIEKSIITASGEDDVSSEFQIPNCTLGRLTKTITAFEKDFSLLSQTLGAKVSGLLSLSKLSTGIVYFDLKSEIVYFN